jgi:quercetin dioxygenase-like cupin family protein
MRFIHFGHARAEPITEYGSHGASAVALGHGIGEAHAYAVHVDPGGAIGPHPAGFGQLFLVVEGSGWVAGADGVRHPVHAGAGAFIARGEVHAKGSESGMTTIMVQVADLAPAPGALDDPPG